MYACVSVEICFMKSSFKYFKIGRNDLVEMMSSYIRGNGFTIKIISTVGGSRYDRRPEHWRTF